MNNDAYQLLVQLRQMGFAVAVFGPDDMPGDTQAEQQANLSMIHHDLESEMVTHGNGFVTGYPDFAHYYDDAIEDEEDEEDEED